MKQSKVFFLCISCLFVFHCALSQERLNHIEISDSLILEGYNKSADLNVLAAVNPKVFFGYFSVCADGAGYGYGNTFPSLDGHQMSEALLWLGQTEVVRANWAYVKSFQKTNGELPIAILPGEAGKEIGAVGYLSRVDSNGGLYKHWVPGNPLRALASTTYIQNADIIFRFTQDRKWLKDQLTSLNLSADYLASMVSAKGMVGGAAYYLERPTRIEYDGVSQCFSADAFFRIAALNKIAGNKSAAVKYKNLAKRIRSNFRKRFWVSDHFAEYINPVKGVISNHGLTDCDWSAIATGVCNKKQKSILWKQLKEDTLFYYDGMPTGIATHPERYEDWEFSYPDRQDLAAMGRVWYAEAWVRAKMNDATGLIETLHRVCKKGKNNGWHWRERYNSKGGYGAKEYNEYPANLIRIVQRFLLGTNFEPDGSITISPTVPDAYWNEGFGQTLNRNRNSLSYTLRKDEISGTYSGPVSQKLSIRLPMQKQSVRKLKMTINGIPSYIKIKNRWLTITVPPGAANHPNDFHIYL